MFAVLLYTSSNLLTEIISSSSVVLATLGFHIMISEWRVTHALNIEFISKEA